jgi:hypothetical protein
VFINVIVFLFGENTNAHKVLNGVGGIGDLKVRKFLEDLGMWENHIEIDLKEREEGGMNWLHRAQDREKCCAVTNTETKLWVP